MSRSRRKLRAANRRLAASLRSEMLATGSTVTALLRAEEKLRYLECELETWRPHVRIDVLPENGDFAIGVRLSRHVLHYANDPRVVIEATLEMVEQQLAAHMGGAR